MPPKGRGQSEEVKAANFEAYQGSEEHKLCSYIFKMRTSEGHELKDLHPGSDDILDDWEKVLASIFKLTEVLKIPGRKAKCKLQFDEHSIVPTVRRLCVIKITLSCTCSSSSCC